MLDKLERKFGKYAISNLTVKLMIVYAVGYVINLAAGDYLTFNPYLIFHGQVWRLVTWILIPLQNNIFLYAVSILLFYLPIGQTMERAWGDFKYNAYLFMGFFLTIAASLLCYLGYVIYAYSASADAATISVFLSMAGSFIGSYTIPYYVTMSIFFAYAATFPNATVLFMFIIPVQMKWLGILYAGLMGYSLVEYIFASQWPGVVVIAASVITFLWFFAAGRNSVFGQAAGRYRPSQVKRRREFHKTVQKASAAAHMVAPGTPIHKCAVCGKTEIDDPTLEFRFCSKCKGNYEYCQDHLFTHVHKV